MNVIHCDICPYCKDLYPDRVDSDGNHYEICGMTGNMVYTEPGRIKRVSGHGWIHYGIGSCRLFVTVDQVLANMTEIERQRYYERTNQNV